MLITPFTNTRATGTATMPAAAPCRPAGAFPAGALHEGTPQCLRTIMPAAGPPACWQLPFS